MVRSIIKVFLNGSLYRINDFRHSVNVSGKAIHCVEGAYDTERQTVAPVWLRRRVSGFVDNDYRVLSAGNGLGCVRIRRDQGRWGQKTEKHNRFSGTG
jgi:hypothetical protein